jgi:hypothetical protein
VTLPLLLAQVALGAELEVGPGRAYATVQEALYAAVDGDRLLIAPGTYYGDLDLFVSVDLIADGNAPVVLTGGSGTTLVRVESYGYYPVEVGFYGVVLDAGGSLRALEVQDLANVVASDVDFVGCGAQSGDGGCVRVLAGGGLELVGSRLVEPTTAPGNGGLVHVAGTLRAVDTIFANGRARSGGAISTSPGAALELAGCEFVDNAATDPSIGGGAVWINASEATMSGCRFAGNSAAAHGGALRVYGGSSVALVDDWFSDNSAGLAGGHVAVTNTSSVLDVSGTTFLRGAAGTTGGAIDVGSASAITVHRSTFDFNAAVTSGGALRVATDTDSAHLETSTWCGNSTVADDGAAVHLYRGGAGEATLAGNAFVANWAGDDGGDLAIEPNLVGGARVDVFNNDFLSSGAADQGAAVRILQSAAGVAPVDFRNNLVAWNGPVTALQVTGVDGRDHGRVLGVLRQRRRQQRGPRRHQRARRGPGAGVVRARDLLRQRPAAERRQPAPRRRRPLPRRPVRRPLGHRRVRRAGQRGLPRRRPRRRRPRGGV